jgi:hypothetical protein
VNIITNNVPRDIVYGYELTDKERKEFEYIDFDSDDGACHDFVRYKGELIDLQDLEGGWGSHIMSTTFKGWSAYRSDTFFSGILVRFVEDYEKVVMGRYYS